MSILTILTAPDPRLKIKAKPVDKVDGTIRKLLADMLETMYAAPGIGLAATQVGVDKRVVVIDLADVKNGEKPNPLKLVNPELIKTGDDDSVYEEGCLSVPGFYEEVVRPATCTVKALDEHGKAFVLEAEGLLATCIQHEIDHLDGHLFIDHIGRMKRSMILRKLQKDKRLGRSRQHDHVL